MSARFKSATMNFRADILPPEDWDKENSTLKIGDFYWTFRKTGHRVIVMCLPCGKFGFTTSLPVYRSGENVAEPSKPKWLWDGNETAPTLRPSVHLNPQLHGKAAERYQWHGHITAGQMKGCES